MLQVEEIEGSNAKNFHFVEELRVKAFKEDFGIEDNTSQDKFDKDCTHLLLWETSDSGKVPVACFRVLFDTEHAKMLFGTLPEFHSSKCGEFSRICMPQKSIPDKARRRYGLFLLYHRGVEVAVRKNLDSVIGITHEAVLKAIRSFGLVPFAWSEEKIHFDNFSLGLYVYDVKEGYKRMIQFQSKL